MLDVERDSGVGAVVISSLEEFIDVIAVRVAEHIVSHDSSLIDQNDRRGLGGRRHIEAVRRRMAEKTGDAFKKGRDYLLTPAAVRQELERLATVERRSPVRKAPAAPKADAKGADAEHERLKRELEADMRAAGRRKP